MQNLAYSPLALFGYDQGTYGLGQRTFLSDTTSTAGWQYDTRALVDGIFFVMERGFLLTAAPRAEAERRAEALTAKPKKKARAR